MMTLRTLRIISQKNWQIQFSKFEVLFDLFLTTAFLLVFTWNQNIATNQNKNVWKNWRAPKIFLKMGERYNIHSQLEHLQSKYIGTGHADTSKFEWATNQHRDTYASYMGHFDMMNYFAIAENESKARIRYCKRNFFIEVIKS